LALVAGHAGDDDALERGVLAGDPGAGSVGEGRPDMHGDTVFHRYLYAAYLEDLGAERRQLEHLFVADAADLSGRFADRRVGRVDPVHVGVDLAHIGADRRRDGDGAGVAAASAEGG